VNWHCWQPWFIFWKALIFRGIKTGRAYIFPQTAPLIVPYQKVTVGALNVVVEVVVECLKNASWNGEGVCTCRRSDAQVSRDQRMKV